jgi:hypothetical protein
MGDLFWQSLEPFAACHGAYPHDCEDCEIDPRRRPNRCTGRFKKGEPPRRRKQLCGRAAFFC